MASKFSIILIKLGFVKLVEFEFRIRPIYMVTEYKFTYIVSEKSRVLKLEYLSQSN